MSFFATGAIIALTPACLMQAGKNHDKSGAETESNIKAGGETVINGS
jgi:hypothetical protein